MKGDWEIIKYEPDRKSLWNEFVTQSRNATFLHLRDYMDYHADRFADYSLMAYRKGKLRAILPANIDREGNLHSHQGLTYGGWLLPQYGVTGGDMLELWNHAIDYMKESGIGKMTYKPVPYIYHMHPSQDDLYALWRIGAETHNVLLASTAELTANPRFDSMRRRHLNYAIKNGVTTREITGPIAEFWEMLCGCLDSRHAAVPVHTLAEMNMLREKFPQNIRFFGAFAENKLLAGICTYITPRVVHCQYIGSTPRGREIHALAQLTASLYSPEKFPECRYLDFGTSNEQSGRVLNVGLNQNKTGYGATGVAYTTYIINLESCRRV